MKKTLTLLTLLLLCACGGEHRFDKINKEIEHLRKTDQHYKAIPLALEGLDIALTKYTSTDENLAIYLDNLAALYAEVGNFAQAERYFSQAIEVWQNALGDNHPKTALTYANLANLYLKAGKYTESENLFKFALSVQEKDDTDKGKQAAITSNNLARLYKIKGNTKTASFYFEKSLKL